MLRTCIGLDKVQPLQVEVVSIVHDGNWADVQHKTARNFVRSTCFFTPDCSSSDLGVLSFNRSAVLAPMVESSRIRIFKHLPSVVVIPHARYCSAAESPGVILTKFSRTGMNLPQHP